MKKNIFLLLLICLCYGGCTDNNFSIYDWQLQIEQSNPNIKNILLHQEKQFFFSLNKKKNGFYACYFKNLEEHKISDSIDSWIETHNNNEKVILEAGYAIRDGFCFKQTDPFNEIHIIYRIAVKNMNRFKFRLYNEKWEYVKK